MTGISKAHDISLAISARLATITTANGFLTDIGSTVMRGRRRIDDSQVPCAVVIEGDDNVTPPPGRFAHSEVRQRYILVGYHPCDPLHPNDKAHEMIRDLKRAVFSDGVTLGGTVLRVEYVGRDIGPRGDGVDIVMATIEIEAKYVDDLSNP